MKRVAVVGAGPAGLSAAYELLSRSNGYLVTVFEKDDSVGGLSRTFGFDSGRVDIGGHRFFSKNEDVLRLWAEVLPEGDCGMLVRKRKSHILWNSSLIEYPIRLNLATMRSLGLIRSLRAVASYLHSSRKGRNIENLEDFYINRFGRELYSIFFEGYTRKLWGLPAKEMSSDWGEQRVRRVSLGGLISSALCGSKAPSERSLVDEYCYPAFGAGQLWDEMASRIVELGGTIMTDCAVEALSLKGGLIESVSYWDEGSVKTERFDYVVSSMPLGELANVVQGLPKDVEAVCDRLHYRDMAVVALELDERLMGPSFLKARDDSWIYIQDDSIGFGRCQILNNWSPFAVKNEGSILLELEYFCCIGDELWSKSDEALAEQALADLKRCGLCDIHAKIVGHLVRRIEKAYPVYADGYHQLATVKSWVNEVDNLICIGRNGQHKYNNMDHSVESGIRAARCLVGESCFSDVWNVNMGNEYLEEQRYPANRPRVEV